jgi:hypothetical protein
MDENREMKVAQLRDRIASGEYTIDATAVADAIVRRLRERAAGRAAATGALPADPRNRQSECSYPDSARSASGKETPGSPSITWPIQVRPLGQLALAASAAPRALRGMQAHSS